MRIVMALLIFLTAITSAGAATVHIVAFGDSATYGYLVPRGQDYPTQLQAALRAKGHDVEVSNQGITGDTTAGALKRFDAAIGPDTKIAIVEFGINDLRHSVSGKALRANPAKSCARCASAALTC